MTPSIAVRIESVLHGLREAIIPAIDPNEALAVEQSGLIVAQLTMLLKQLPYADRYHRLCREDARATAADLVVSIAGGPRSVAAAKALAGIIHAPAPDDAHADYLIVAEAIANLTACVTADAEDTWRAHVEASVLAFAIRQNGRERVWFKGAGFDPEPAAVPDLETLCATAHSFISKES